MKKWLIVAALFLSGCAQELKYQVPADEAVAKIEEAASDELMEFPHAARLAVTVAFENNAADRVGVWTYSYAGKELGKLMASVTPDGDAASKVTINFVDGAEKLDNRGTTIRRLLESDQVLLAKEVISAKFENRKADEKFQRQLSSDLTSMDALKVMQELPQMQRDAMATAAAMDHDEREYRDQEHDRQQEQLVNPNGYGNARR